MTSLTRRLEERNETVLLTVKNPNNTFTGIVTLDTETGIVYSRTDRKGVPLVKVRSVHHPGGARLTYSGDAAVVFWRAVMRGAQMLGDNF